MTAGAKNVFISHVHDDDVGLGDLKALLSKNGMDIRDYSINSENPNNAQDENYIKTAILGPRIKSCSVLVVYISPQTKHSAWVNWEIEFAQKNGLRIVGVWAHGENGCEAPAALVDLADQVVGWHGDSIINAINSTEIGWRQPDGSPLLPKDIKRAEC